MKRKVIIEISGATSEEIAMYSRMLMKQNAFVVSVEIPLQRLRSIDELIPSDSHPKITLGSYTIQQMPNNPLKIWIEDTTTGEAGEFDKVALDYEIHKFYKGNF